MPILSKVIYIKWSISNRAWYEYKGYEFTKYNKYFKVLIKDLIPHTSTKVAIQCDFCGKITYKAFYRCQYICNCSDKECIEKRKKMTNLRKYGVPYAWQARQTRLKIIDILKKKYGVEKVSDIPFIKEKIWNTKKENNTIKSSKQQNRLHRLFGGELNYPFNNYAIDIALTDNKIAIEYNGSGHDLAVQKGWETAEEFNDKELQRRNYLIDNGWKVIIFISSDDQLTTNMKLRRLFNFAKECFIKYNKKYIIIDFNKQQILIDDYIFPISTAY